MLIGKDKENCVVCGHYICITLWCLEIKKIKKCQLYIVTAIMRHKQNCAIFLCLCSYLYHPQHLLLPQHSILSNFFHVCTPYARTTRVRTHAPHACARTLHTQSNYIRQQSCHRWFSPPPLQPLLFCCFTIARNWDEPPRRAKGSKALPLVVGNCVNLDTHTKTRTCTHTHTHTHTQNTHTRTHTYTHRVTAN